MGIKAWNDWAAVRGTKESVDRSTLSTPLLESFQMTWMGKLEVKKHDSKEYPPKPCVPLLARPMEMKDLVNGLYSILEIRTPCFWRGDKRVIIHVLQVVITITITYAMQLHHSHLPSPHGSVHFWK